MVRPFAAGHFATNVAATPIVTTTETVLCTVSGISTQAPDGGVVIEGEVQITPGTATSGIIIRVHRGVDATGPTVNNPVTQGIAAGVTVDLEIQCQDFPGEVDGQTYVMTIQQVSATGNGVNVFSTLQATY